MDKETLLEAIRQHHEQVKSQAGCEPDLWHDPAWATDRKLWATAGIVGPSADRDGE